MTKLAYRITETAEALGVCRATVYRMIDDGTLSAFKVRGGTRITAESINRLVEGALR